jgi:hypothetical protein
LSYFAKPNFIVYDEWFDDNFKKTKLDFKKKKIKTISNMHEFFYEQSNYKVGASENNMQLEIKVNKKELFNRNYLENNSSKDELLTNKKLTFFDKITKNKFKLNLKKKIIYSFPILGFVIILVLLIFVISQSKNNESTSTNKSILLEKKILIF